MLAQGGGRMVVQTGQLRSASPRTWRGWGAPLLFVLLVYGLAWPAFGAAMLISAPGSPPTASATLLGLVGTFAPAAAAIVLTGVEGGAPAIQRLIARIFQFRASWRWYVFALGFLPAARLTAALLHKLISGAWPPFGGVSALDLIASILISMPFQAGEELGWRGWLLPRLGERIGYAPASLVVGLVWGPWHLPLFFAAVSTNQGQPILLFLIASLALSVAMAWLYVNVRGALFLTMLMHASVNNTTQIVPTRTSGPVGLFSLHWSLVMWLFAAVLVASAAYFLWRLRLYPRSPNGGRGVGP
jgi:membrane protease YdiL (CAAX protease family)